MGITTQLKGANIGPTAEQADNIIIPQLVEMVASNVKLLRLNLKHFMDDTTKAIDSQALKSFYDLVHSYGIKMTVCMPPRDVITTEWFTVADVMGFWDDYISNVGEHQVIIAYEPCNEPDQIVGWWTAGMQDGIDKIRTFSNKTVIISEGFSWFPDGAETDPTVFSDGNLWWSYHSYDPRSPVDYTHQGVTPIPVISDSYGLDLVGESRLLNEPITWNKENMRRHFNVIRDWEKKHDVTIFVGEFSTHNVGRNCDIWIKDTVEIFNEFNWIWCYHSWDLPEGVGYVGWRPKTHRMSILKKAWLT